MTPDRFNAIADRWGWSRRYLATRFDTGSTTIDNWGTGRVSIPPSVEAWMETMDRVFAALPPPTREQWHRLLPMPKELVQAHPGEGCSAPADSSLAPGQIEAEEGKLAA